MSRQREIDWDDAAIGARLGEANGRRTARTLTLEQVHACAADALASPVGFAWRSGGEVDDARDFTTVCLVVAGRDDVTIGVAVARANGVTPERAWPELEGWDRYSDAANVTTCLAWAGRQRKDRVHLQYRRSRAVTASREELLEAVLAHPDDDAARLVYADWLTEHGDPRGELIAVQCELARLGEDQLLQRHRLEAREAALLSQHGPQWRGALDSEAIELEFTRGFASHVTILDGASLPQVEEFLRVEPVEHLVLANTRGLDVPRLAAARWLERLRSLELRSAQAGAAGALVAEDVGRLLESRHLRGLRSLRLVGHRLDDVGALVLAANVPSALPALVELGVEQDVVSSVGAQGLASTRWLGALAVLSLADNELRAEGAEAIGFARSPGHLRVLNLDGNHLGDEGARILAGAPRLASLHWLSLARNRIGPAGAEALLASVVLRGLEWLELGGNSIGQRARLMIESRFQPRRS